MKPRNIAILVAVLVALARAQAQTTFPTEVYPGTSTVQSLNGTTDPATGLAYIASGTNPASNPPLQIQIDRRWQRENAILAAANAGRVVKVGDTAVGVFPLHFRIQGTDHYFAGNASTAISTSNGTYLVYLVSNGSGGGTVTVTAEATGWPADTTTYIPLAEVNVAGNIISTIKDVRNRVVYATTTSGGAAASGVDGAWFVLDQDNAAAGASSDYRFNRGSTADDAGLRWNETGDVFEFLANVTTPTYGPLRALTIESTAATGTAPLTIASSTRVVNLNADMVDGVGLIAPTAANQVAFSTSTSAAGFTNAAAAGQVLFADAGAIPTWGARGSPSGVQAWDADLDGLAAIATTGFIARTGAGTAASRTLVAGANIIITNPAGTADNPELAVGGTTLNAVQIGSAGGALQSLTVGQSNTVLAGNTGAAPTFRQVVDADIATTAAINGTKLATYSVPPEAIAATGSNKLLCNDGDGGFWGHLWTVANIGGGQTISPAAADLVALTSDAISSPKILTLASLEEGMQTLLVCKTTQGIRLTMPAGATVRDGATVGAAGGYIQSTTVGSTATLVAVSTTELWVVAKTGTWTVN